MNIDILWVDGSLSLQWVIVLVIILSIIVIWLIWRLRLLSITKKAHARSADSVSTLKSWHNDSAKKVMEDLLTSPDGLMNDEVTSRLKKYGKNQLPEPVTLGALQRFLYQFHNILIYVLIAAGIMTAFLGHWIDASVIMGVVIINAIIGFVQEGKAENALKAIRQMLSTNAMVIRENKQQSIEAQALVPGDIVLLQSGDKVPADLRLIRVKGLLIQESVLTGESLAVEKVTENVDLKAVIGDRLCMAYSGTLVTHGQATAVVVATGAFTELGRISSLVSQVELITTPLLKQMAQFSRWLTLTILGIAVITFGFGILVHDYQMGDMFLAAVSLAVAAIPEGLPAIMTITLAIGVQKMAQRNSIIRRLPAVETLGAVSVICSDKTGTLTRNEMTVRSIMSAHNYFQLDGTGYDPHGAVLVDNEKILPTNVPIVVDVLRAAILCNDASLEQKQSEWLVHGDPMEGALLVAGLKADLNIEDETKQYPRTDLIPFESEHRFMATLHHNHIGNAFIFLKGAPERVLELCTLQMTNEGDQPIDREYWLNSIEKLAQQGQRVLAIAFKPAQRDQVKLNFDDVDDNLIMLGMFGLIDPPREEAIEAIATCKGAGIRVKMITGDHGATALAISKQLNLTNTNDVLTGQDIESMTEDSLRRRVLEVDVYARVNPEHKLLLVRLLQEQSLIIAMTGDGVNDAPALKRADVGIAMGANGTEAAKEAAEMVLVDDNFASIAHAVEEGRTVYDNLKKAILFILPTNGGEALIIMAAIILGFEQLPLTAVQILWVNMITAVTLALSLTFEPSEEKVMKRAPRRAQQPLLTPHLLWRIAFVSFILMSGTFGLFLWELEIGASIEHARTVAVNTLVMFEIFYLFNSRYITAPVLNWSGFTGNPYVLLSIALLFIFQLGFTYLAPLQRLFGTVAIDLTTWILITLVSSSVLFLVETEKYIVRIVQQKKRINQ